MKESRYGWVMVALGAFKFQLAFYPDRFEIKPS